MCVIVAKAKDKRLPSIEELTNCFNRNSDGAGFMYTDGANVVIDKGYMSLKSFLKHFKKLCKRYNNFEGQALVLHFRIGTAGTNSQANTHPYPISDSVEVLHKVFYKSDLGIVHNGIISAYNPKSDANDTNDTQEFIINYLTPLKEHWNEFYKNPYMLKGIREITGSRFVIMNTNGELYYVGDFIEHDGVLYSNESYKKTEPVRYSSYGYHGGWWDNDDYYFASNYYKPTPRADREQLELPFEDDTEEPDIIELKKGYWIEWGENYEQVKKDGEYFYDLNNAELLNADLKVIKYGVTAFNEQYEQLY